MYKVRLTVPLCLSLIVLILAPFLSACNPAGVSAQPGSRKGSIAISGAFALYPMVVRWADEYQNLYAGVRIDISAGGAGKGMADTLSGVVDIGMISRDIKPEEYDQGAYGIAVVKDAVFPVVNADNPILATVRQKGISKDVLASIYIQGDITTWGEVAGSTQIIDQIHVYTRSDSAGAAEVWAIYLGGRAQEDLLGVGVNSDPGILDAVIKDRLGIGYNNLNYVFDAKTGRPAAGAVVLPIDINNNGQVDPDEIYETKEAALKAVAEGIYPSPPARILYLVTKGKPGGATADFLRWILTDGQQYVLETGYITLSAGQLSAEQAKLE